MGVVRVARIRVLQLQLGQVGVSEVEETCVHRRGQANRQKLVEVLSLVVCFFSPCKRGGRDDVGEGKELFHRTKHLPQHINARVRERRRMMGEAHSDGMSPPSTRGAAAEAATAAAGRGTPKHSTSVKYVHYCLASGKQSSLKQISLRSRQFSKQTGTMESFVGTCLDLLSSVVDYNVCHSDGHGGVRGSNRS